MAQWQSIHFSYRRSPGSKLFFKLLKKKPLPESLKSCYWSGQTVLCCADLHRTMVWPKHMEHFSVICPQFQSIVSGLFDKRFTIQFYPEYMWGIGNKKTHRILFLRTALKGKKKMRHRCLHFSFRVFALVEHLNMFPKYSWLRNQTKRKCYKWFY